MRSSLLKVTVGPIFALTFYALPLLSEICASTASPETPSTAEEQVEKTAVDHALSEESDAFGRGDLSAFVQHFDVPFVRISSQGVKVCPTLSEIEAFYGGLLQDLRARGYSRSTRSELHVKLLDQSTALASAVFVRHKTDGSELETIGATYVLRKTEGEWKIAVVMGHPPANVIRAD